MYLLFLTIGILIGIFSKKIILKKINSLLLVKKYSYNVRFHVYFIMHRSNNKLNEIIKTESLEISIIGKDEDDVIEFLRDLVKNETRIEIESIELCN